MNINRRSFITAIVMGAVQSAFSLGTVWIIKEFVDMYQDEMFDSEFKYVSTIALSYLLIYIILYFSSKYAAIRSMTDIRIKIKRKVFEAFIWEKTDNAERKNAGEIVNIFERQVDSVESMYYQSIYNVAKNSVLIFASLTVAFLAQWEIALLGIALIAVYFPLTKRISSTLSALQKDMIDKNSIENVQLTNLIEGYHLAKDMRAEAFFESKYENAVADYTKSFRKMNVGYYYLTLFKSGIEPLLVLVVLCAGVIMRMSDQSQITMGTVLAMTQLIPTIISPVSVLGEGISKISSTKRLKSELDSFIQDGMSGKSDWLQERENFIEFEGIQLENVSFGYDDHMVLENLDVNFESGKKYAVIGESASGKTTLIKLITKQLTPKFGTIKWNGIECDRLNHADIIKLFSYVSQNMIMFDGNIRDNITLDKEMAQEKFDKIVGLCKLLKLEEDFETRNADDLSVGEQKRVSLARALYRDKGLIILDEFTSALDETNALALEDMILSLPGISIINITHRLTKERESLYDCVYRIEGGKLVNVGD